MRVLRRSHAPQAVCSPLCHGEGAMTPNEPNSPAQTAAKRLRFDRYVLDLDRGCLLFEGSEITLRPKTFAVLRHLVENSGRLVSKDELFAAVWPNLAVTDDALVQSIGELRQGLGDDGARLIKTIPRRGYRFESAVSINAPLDPSMTDATPELAASHDGAPTAKPAIPVHAGTVFPAGHPGWRGGLFAAAAIVILLASGMFLILRSEWNLFSIPRPGGQFSKTAEVGAKPAIAVSPL
jgi:DNA-binding winged helix-turn-helix (wHTH) protein